MPRLGEQLPSRHHRIFSIMLVAALSAASLVGFICYTEAPLMSLRDWATSTTTAADTTAQIPPQLDSSPDVNLQGHRHRFDDLTMIERLPRHLLPTAANGRRLLIIGDIHGMDAALDRLLAHVDFDPATDHIVAAGDMINKGPHSARVVARLMDLGASAVRGNHEDRVLLALASEAEQDEAAESVPFPEFQERRSKKRDRKTARQLSPAQLRWLAERPLILTAEELGMYVVHAGLVPGIRPRKQDPWAVMNMRSLIEPPRHHLAYQAPGQDDGYLHEDGDEEGEDAHASFTLKDLIPVDTHEGREWAELWDRQQAQIPKAARHTVVYGHDAKRGLTLGKHTFGLDSACVNGGELTALVIHVGKKGHVKRKIRQVPCKRYATPPDLHLEKLNHVASLHVLKMLAIPALPGLRSDSAADRAKAKAEASWGKLAAGREC
ncbi:Ser Thr phosphatase family [Cordyceps militaris]|uniref:Ser Thr phosphatase family n=1 Tax=Cordyceps militaris TaxID=73501 RepID=A0A2H4SAY1_CORMI|nr:Ser Thr phosphatase family [Cordyceps militaris]